jgi:signal transduction histidine kinase
VADFVTQLGSRPDAGMLSLAVRRALGDPTAQVGFWLADQHRYVDDRGAPFHPPEGADRRVIRIDDHGRRAALLVQDAAASQHQQLTDEVVAALRLALGNARLQADVRAHVVELGRVRRRLVEASDLQQRQLEADLGRGPQRRLSQTARLLARASAQAGAAMRARLEAARDEVVRAQLELHELTLGIRPPSLESGGLAAALPPLIDRSNLRGVTLTVTAGRLSPAIEGALYFVCTEALVNVAKHAKASEAAVEISIDGGVVVGRITDNGTGGAEPAGPGLRGLRDRVEALDGSLTVGDRSGGGTVLEVRIPIEEPPILVEEEP